jgi:hypothetical protein
VGRCGGSGFYIPPSTTPSDIIFVAEVEESQGGGCEIVGCILNVADAIVDEVVESAGSTFYVPFVTSDGLPSLDELPQILTTLDTLPVYRLCGTHASGCEQLIGGLSFWATEIQMIVGSNCPWDLEGIGRRVLGTGTNFLNASADVADYGLLGEVAFEGSLAIATTSLTSC